MAKNNSLPDFLSDLAGSIRSKEGSTGAINPQDFSQRIKDIPVLKGQEKEVTVKPNSNTVVEPDTGYTAITELTVNVKEPIDLSYQDIYGNPISQTTANCYVISEPGEYKFPLVYGNAITLGSKNSEAYTNNGGTYSMNFVNHLDNQITSPYIYENSGCVPVSVEISLSDTENALTELRCTGEEIIFTVPEIPVEGGNVVVSVLDGSNVVLWSWHIWLWGDDLMPVTITNNTGYEYDILPVNLATKKDSGHTESSPKLKNWFYQWGRSVPMLCPSAYTSNVDHTNYGTKTFTKMTTYASTYGKGIKNPQYFYKYNYDGTSNWFGSSSYYNLWNVNCTSTGNSDDTVIKTIYDPCPIGFTVPNGNTFTGFSTSNVVGSFHSGCGYYFKRYSEDTTGVFFPASGYRYNSSGSLGNVASKGCVWLSSAYNQGYAYELYFYSGGVNPQTSSSLASGLSVRPVTDSRFSGQGSIPPI